MEIHTWGRLVLDGDPVPVTEVQIADLESRIGRTLPTDFRAFLAAAHGCTLPYAVPVAGHLISFSDLYTVEDLAQEWADYPQTHAAELLPPELLCVAGSGSGSELYVDLRPESLGTVHAFVEGRPAWTGGREEYAGVLAPTWTAYLESLVIEDDFAGLVWGDRTSEDEPRILAWLDSGLPDWRDRAWARDTAGPVSDSEARPVEPSFEQLIAAATAEARDDLDDLDDLDDQGRA